MPSDEFAPPATPGGVNPWKIVLLTLLAVMVLAGAGVVGYVVGTGSGSDLSQARRSGAASGARMASAELTLTRVRAARREGRRSGYKLAFRRAAKLARAEVASGGPHNCGNVATGDTPSLGKVRAEGVTCAMALNFVRNTRGCEGDFGTPCQGYTCSSTEIGYEEGEVTCRRDKATIRYVSGV